MKKDDLGALIGLLGAIAFFAPILIKFYQEDILLGIAITGAVMIVIGLVIIITSKVK